MATGLLVLMLVFLIATHMVIDPGFATMLLRSAAEAGTVGGLADWFAVTALFRYPLGLPIPHTAIIPSNKDRIGEALGRFVERNFLTEEALLAKLRNAHAAERLAHWLATPETAAMISGRLAAALPHVIRSLENDQLRNFTQRIASEQLRQMNIASMLAQAIRLFASSAEADMVFERGVGVAAELLKKNKRHINEVVAERSRWWVPRTIDQRIASGVVRSLTEWLGELRQPQSETRCKFQESLSKLVDELLNSPELSARVNAFKNRLLEHPEFTAWMHAIWNELSQAALDDLAQPQSKTRKAVETATMALGHALARDADMHQQVDLVLEQVIMQAVSHRSEIGTFIAEVVRRWDTATVTERLELVVGSDLQYIRINGTLVGACAGCLIFIASWPFR
jgi:uncharacterized membrane-anchored protein YjiN (DUF445 family)